MSREEEIRELARRYANPLVRARRIYLDHPSYAVAGKRDVEFEIKQELAEYFNIPFGRVTFCGSAHLGFSPRKGTRFTPGESDLDVAIIDTDLFQRYWQITNDVTKAFNDLTGFSIYRNPQNTIDALKEMIVKRGVIFLDKMPKCQQSDRDASFLYSISAAYTNYFKKITVAVYMNEYAYCWKQNAALQALLPG